VAKVELSGVTKDFSGGVRAVDQLSLEIEDGEFVVLVGPSGCGKTTALRMIAGLESVTEGVISIDGRVVNDVPSARRDVAMVFQNYALYPHMTVFENMAFGLQQRRMPKREIEAQVVAIARLLELEPYLKRKPRALSGGQRQRVAMGRAIVRHPSVFLMDEPLSNLDAKLRVQMRAEIRALQRELGVTTIYVTHDQIEAMTMGDRVAVLRGGVLQQVAPPDEVYHHPANVFVAGFIGSPAMNLLEATSSSSSGFINVAGLPLEVPKYAHLPSDRHYAVGIRPESITLVPEGIAARVIYTEDLGAEVIVHFLLDAPALDAAELSEASEDEGDAVLTRLGVGGDGARVVARLPASTSVSVDERVQIAFDRDKLHVFDRDSGVAVERRGESALVA
jgi:multiple sugar transport system ATP-binding protein